MTLQPVAIRRMFFAQPTEEQHFDGLLANANCTVVAAGWYPCQPEWVLPKKAQPFYTLFACVGGSADFVVGGRSYKLHRDSVLLCPPRIPRVARHDPADPLHVYVVWFHAQLYGVLDLLTVYRFPVAWQPTPDRMTQIIRAIQHIIAELAAQEPGYVLATNGQCAQLLAVLYRDAAAWARDDSGDDILAAVDVYRLAPAFQLIQRHYGERLSLDELASAVHLHPTYFSSVFRRATGLPPHRYLSRYRLERARELLLSTDLPVTQIAKITGFRDPFYLSRTFHHTVGVSPSAYRKAARNTELL